MPELKPEPTEIGQHLHHITRRWHELDQPCLLEVVFLTPDDVAQVKGVYHYEPTEAGLAEAADHIAKMNPHHLNAYSVVNPIDANNRPPTSGRASAEHIVASFFHFADADTEKAANNIRSFVGPKCTFHVLTGSVPSQRPHVYWELEEPTRNLAAWTRTQRAIAATLGTDLVVDPPRIMRIAGTINWPKPKKQTKGYVPQVTHLRIYNSDERQPVSSERMERAFGGATERPADGDGFTIDTGTPQPLDRERLAIQALSGAEWHNAVIRLVASYVAMGLSDAEIHSLTEPLTLAGYTLEQTRREVQTAINGARAKGWAPEPEEPYADPEDIDFDAKPEDKTGPGPGEQASSDLEWFDDIEPILTDGYLVKGVLSTGAMSVIYGPSNSGKTFFALDLAFHIATGTPWQQRRVKAAAVLYLAAEGGRGVANRIAALKVETGCVSVPLALRRAGLDLLKSNADLQHIVDLVREVTAKWNGMPILIVIDTLSRIMAGGDENSAADMTALIRNIDAIRAHTGAHIMLVHHTGKDTARGARGHSSLRAATDTEIEVQNEDGARAAQVQKQRDYPGTECFAFGLKSVVLGIDQDGDEVASCVVEWQDSEDFTEKRDRTKGLGGNQKLIAETFDQMLSEGLGRPNPGGVGMPEPGHFWTVEAEELRRISRGKMIATDTRSAFNQAMKVLIEERGLFVTGGNLIWRVDRRTNQCNQ